MTAAERRQALPISHQSLSFYASFWMYTRYCWPRTPSVVLSGIVPNPCHRGIYWMW
jgi:hypothetical protein